MRVGFRAKRRGEEGLDLRDSGFRRRAVNGEDMHARSYNRFLSDYTIYAKD
jgi:hypothetical protein